MAPTKENHLLKILTVDDSRVISERLKEILGEMEHVEFSGNATNSSTALDLIERLNPSVVILDINLGEGTNGISGIDLLITLRKKYSNIKIVMLTNLTEPVYRSTCLFLGADYFLDKSNEFEKIPETLNEILRLQING